ncbi:MAG: 5'-nucleotidase C-terminal domain-containing protein [Myxococcota bacterium]|jgi:2',3'-cyclic-nucleotide 2'-phosphodiesterase (5'-nucleotidase family)
MRLSFPVAVSACLFLAACPDKPVAPPPPVEKDAGPPARDVTVLVTGHESGELPLRAPRLLQVWKDEERWPDVIALSTGDMFSGNAISSHFDGLPTAEAMKAMQYRAASLGNHDLDLGVEVLKTFVERAGLTLLAANVIDREKNTRPLPGHVVIERGGVKVGVIGLTSEKTLYTTEPGRADQYKLDPAGLVLPAAIAEARKAGAEALVVVIDDCFSTVQPLFAAHPEWDVDAVVGGRCEGPQESTEGKVPFYSVGDDLSAYVSIHIRLPGTGAHEVKTSRRVISAEGKEDEDLAALKARWEQKLSAELGQVIGYSRQAYAADAPELRVLVATALRDETKADAALVNRKGVRAGIPAGPITRATVYTMMPFDNAVMTVKVKGELLTKLKTHPEAVMVLPKKVEPDKDYVLATTEYLYFGGDDLGFEPAAPNPELSGQVWQTPVIAWLAKQATTEKKPLTLKK